MLLYIHTRSRSYMYIFMRLTQLYNIMAYIERNSSFFFNWTTIFTFLLKNYELSCCHVLLKNNKTFSVRGSEMVIKSTSFNFHKWFLWWKIIKSNKIFKLIMNVSLIQILYINIFLYLHIRLFYFQKVWLPKQTNLDLSTYIQLIFASTSLKIVLFHSMK